MIEGQGTSCSHTARAFWGAQELLITIRASPNEQNWGAEPRLAPSPALPALLDVSEGGLSPFYGFSSFAWGCKLLISYLPQYFLPS